MRVLQHLNLIFFPEKLSQKSVNSSIADGLLENLNLC